MSTYFKYHVASGHIMSRLTVVDASHLEAQREPEYEFMPVAEGAEPKDYYVTTGGTLEVRSKIATGGNKSSGVGENIEISGLPQDCWVRYDNKMVKSTNGKVSTSLGSEGKKLVEVVGKYIGNPYFLAWTMIDGLKSETKSQIDADAEAARARVITIGSGQAMTYIRKAEAARAHLAGDTLSDAQMMRLNDEATRLGISLDAACQSLVATADAWETIDAHIDNIRLTKKADVDAAKSGAQVASIYAGIQWPV